MKSNHDGCHPMWFVRGPLIQLLEIQHDQRRPWWHTVCHLPTEVDEVKLSEITEVLRVNAWR